nr:hypothetical protein Iba_chr12eCG8970 [Ipomoea batatas]
MGREREKEGKSAYKCRERGVGCKVIASLVYLVRRPLALGTATPLTRGCHAGIPSCPPVPIRPAQNLTYSFFFFGSTTNVRTTQLWRCRSGVARQQQLRGSLRSRLRRASFVRQRCRFMSSSGDERASSGGGVDLRLPAAVSELRAAAA